MNRYALITGASSGIGHELATLFARDSHNVILVARREEKLTRFARKLEENFNIKAHVLINDLSQLQSARGIYDWVSKNKFRVDFLINNAGFVVYGSFSGTRWEDELRMMQLHMETTTHLIKLFLQDMLRNERGRILIVGSTGSFVPGPFVSVYCATKSYLLSLSEALAEELRGSGVTITTLCPGGTKTEFEAKAIRKQPFKPRSGGMQAEKVASIAYRALIRGKRIAIPGLLNKIQVFAIRFLPRTLVTRLTGMIMSEY